MRFMSAKKILLFFLLLLLAYTGGFFIYHGTADYAIYGGPERDFNSMKPSELQNMLNIKGTLDSAGELMVSAISENGAQRDYYVLPLVKTDDNEQQRYCVIAVTTAEDRAALAKLSSGGSDKFEFRAVCMNMETDMHLALKKRLWKIYDTMFDIYTHENVEKYIIPYTIFVKHGEGSDSVAQIIIGGVILVISLGIFAVLAVRTYKKAHQYD